MPVPAVAAPNKQQTDYQHLLNPDNSAEYYYREINDDDNDSLQNSLYNINVVSTDQKHQRSEDNTRPKEPPTWKEEYAKSIIYAGMDSIITCFSLISSISAGRLSSVDVLVLGFANLVADGISMGFGDFVSTSTESDLAATERDATRWDVMHYPESQQRDLIQKYQELGMDQNDATMVVKLFSKYKDILVDEKLRTQKSVIPSDQEGQKPWKNGLVTFISFLLFGTAPLLSFIILIPFTKNDNIKFTCACILSMFALLLLGLARAKIAARSYVRSAMLTILTGVIAAAVAYGVGWTLRNMAGIEEDTNP